jgi:hypothetical protein
LPRRSTPGCGCGGTIAISLALAGRRGAIPIRGAVAVVSASRTAAAVASGGLNGIGEFVEVDLTPTLGAVSLAWAIGDLAAVCNEVSVECLFQTDDMNLVPANKLKFGGCGERTSECARSTIGDPDYRHMSPHFRRSSSRDGLKLATPATRANTSPSRTLIISTDMNKSKPRRTWCGGAP